MFLYKNDQPGKSVGPINARRGRVAFQTQTMDEITAEFTATELVAPIALTALPRVTIGVKTDIGRRRENNEDKFEFVIPEDGSVLASRGQVFLVCDGMGGHAAGQIASELACKTFIDVYYNHPTQDPNVAIYGAVVAANRFILNAGRSNPSRNGMGTTLTGLVLIQDKAFVVQVGDSRCYRLRGSQFDGLTLDHTYIEEMVRSGAMTREHAENHPQKHMLTRAVGVEDVVVPDIFEFDLQEKDTFLLCSDGLLNHVADPSIRLSLDLNPPSNAAWDLVGQALLDGGTDNVTVMVVRVDELLRFNQD